MVSFRHTTLHGNVTVEDATIFEHCTGKQTFDDYMQHMDSDDCWGGYSQIGAIAAMLRVDIHVFQDEHADDAPMTQEAILCKQGLQTKKT